MQRETETRLRSALACAAFQYPLYIAAQFALNAMPALLRAVILRQQLAYFRLSPFGISAAVASDASAGFGTAASLGALLQTMILAVILIALLALAQRRSALLAGSAVATLGFVGLLNPTWQLFIQKNWSFSAVIQFLFFFAVICLGLRWMLASAPAETYVAHAASLLASFNVPLLLLGLVFAQILQLRAARFLWVMLPAAIATLLVSAFQAKESTEHMAAGLRLIAAGVAFTALVIVGVVWGGPAINQVLREAELAKGRAAMEALPKILVDAPYEKNFFQKGVSYTAEFPAVYASEAARELLKQLPSYGVNAIALVPFGGATRNPPGVRFFSTSNSWESDEGIEQLSRVAHSISVKVMLKPQLWSRGGDWQELDIQDAAQRAQWFVEYQAFIEHYAQLAARIHADLFCVGVELGKLVQHDAEWRKLIARVREIYPGPLVYAANFGTEFENVKFWDALDYIGLDNYYPLPDDFSTDAVVSKIEAVHKKFQRPVLFTEAGFASREGSHIAPWQDGQGKISLGEQARGYEALLHAFYDKPWFAGVYWWKVGTNGRGGPNDASLTPWGKPAMDVMRRWYVEGRR